MKIFAIIDEETTLLTGILLYYEKEGTCVIELPEYLDELNCSPSSRQLKKYKFFLPVEIICWQFYAACK